MQRVSSNMSNNDTQYSLRIREWQMNRLQNQMADGTKVQQLRDDPMAAANSTRYLSKITRLQQYSRNAESLLADQRITEGYMDTALSVLHRAKELAIQGANGTYGKEERAYMAGELNQLLNELVTVGNAKDGNGRAIFAGDKTQSEAFRIFQGHVPGVADSLITRVNYTGTANQNWIEISEGSYIEGYFPGSQFFWAEQQQIFTNIDASAYQVLEDQAIIIDGTTINLTTGDNVQGIIAKINSSGAPVEASLDPVKNSLMFKTTVPHQIWMEDAQGGTVLADLGVVTGFGKPPYNFDPSARVSGGSVFDMIISLRDSLYAGDVIDIGGRELKGIDLAFQSINNSIGKIGAQDERLNLVMNRIAYEIPEIKQKNSQEVDVDFTEAITNLKLLERNHQAALQTAARIIQPTLLDFLR